MASYYDDYTYYGEPDYYGSSDTYQEPNNYAQSNIYEEPQYFEDTLYCHASLEPAHGNEEPNYEEPQYYEDAPPHCHTDSEPVDDDPGYENWPTYNDAIPRLLCYEDLHPIYQDHAEGLGDCAMEEVRDDEGHGSNKSAEYPPHSPSLDNIANNVCLSDWVDPDPNDELSDEEWKALVAEQNAASNAEFDAREQKINECVALLNSMDPLEQDKLNYRLDLLVDDADDAYIFHRKFMDLVNLMAVEKSSLLFSLDTTALPPQFDCSPDPPPHITSTASARQPRPPQKTRSQHIYLVTATPKHFTHFRTQNRPTQHRHPPRKKPPPSQPYPTPRQYQYSDSRTKPHRKHPPNHNLPTNTTLDIGNNARRRISQKAARISRH